MRIETGIVQRADTDAIRFELIAAGEVDLALQRRSLGNRHAGLDGLGAASGNARYQRAQHQRRGDNALPLVCVDRARDVALRDVRDFVRQHAGELVLVARGLDQAGVHTDVAAGQGEGVDARIVDDEELEAVVSVVGLRGNAHADFVDVFGDDGVFDHLSALPDLRHDGPTETLFLRFGQHRVSGTADVRQLNVVGTGTRHRHEQRGSKGQGKLSASHQHVFGSDWVNRQAFPP